MKKILGHIPIFRNNDKDKVRNLYDEVIDKIAAGKIFK